MIHKKEAVSLMVLITIVLIGFSLAGNDAVEQSQHTISSPVGGTMMKLGKNAIYVSEQKLGKTANVAIVVLEKKGYVVIHEIVEGNPGKVLGASALLPEGQSHDVAVNLSESLQLNKSYGAMLHFDNGDGVFDAASDISVKDEINNDNSIMMEFQASKQPVSGGVINM